MVLWGWGVKDRCGMCVVEDLLEKEHANEVNYLGMVNKICRLLVL